MPVKTVPASRQDILRKYPRLTAHLVCHSLGYFTPESAAGAILAHVQKRSSYSEWYMTMVGGVLRERGYSAENRASEEETEAAFLEVGRKALRRSFRYRRSHRGYMAEYRQARSLVERSRQTGDSGALFMSW